MDRMEQVRMRLAKVRYCVPAIFTCGQAIPFFSIPKVLSKKVLLLCCCAGPHFCCFILFHFSSSVKYELLPTMVLRHVILFYKFSVGNMTFTTLLDTCNLGAYNDCGYCCFGAQCLFRGPWDTKHGIRHLILSLIKIVLMKCFGKTYTCI